MSEFPALAPAVVDRDRLAIFPRKPLSESEQSHAGSTGLSCVSFLQCEATQSGRFAPRSKKKLTNVLRGRIYKMLCLSSETEGSDADQ